MIRGNIRSRGDEREGEKESAEAMTFGIFCEKYKEIYLPAEGDTVLLLVKFESRARWPGLGRRWGFGVPIRNHHQIQIL